MEWAEIVIFPAGTRGVGPWGGNYRYVSEMCKIGCLRIWVNIGQYPSERQVLVWNDAFCYVHVFCRKLVPTVTCTAAGGNICLFYTKWFAFRIWQFWIHLLNFRFLFFFIAEVIYSCVVAKSPYIGKQFCIWGPRWRTGLCTYLLSCPSFVVV